MYNERGHYIPADRIHQEQQQQSYGGGSYHTAGNRSMGGAAGPSGLGGGMPSRQPQPQQQQQQEPQMSSFTVRVVQDYHDSIQLDVPGKPCRYLLLNEGAFSIRLESGTQEPFIAKLEIDGRFTRSNYRILPNGTHTIRETRGGSGMHPVPLSFTPSEDQRIQLQSLEQLDAVTGELRVMFFSVGDTSSGKWTILDRTPIATITLRYGFADPIARFFGLNKLAAPSPKRKRSPPRTPGKPHFMGTTNARGPIDQFQRQQQPTSSKAPPQQQFEQNAYSQHHQHQPQATSTMLNDSLPPEPETSRLPKPVEQPITTSSAPQTSDIMCSQCFQILYRERKQWEAELHKWKTKCEQLQQKLARESKMSGEVYDRLYARYKTSPPQGGVPAEETSGAASQRAGRPSSRGPTNRRRISPGVSRQQQQNSAVDQHQQATRWSTNDKGTAMTPEAAAAAPPAATMMSVPYQQSPTPASPGGIAFGAAGPHFDTVDELGMTTDDEPPMMASVRQNPPGVVVAGEVDEVDHLLVPTDSDVDGNEQHQPWGAPHEAGDETERILAQAQQIIAEESMKQQEQRDMDFQRELMEEERRRQQAEAEAAARARAQREERERMLYEQEQQRLAAEAAERAMLEKPPSIVVDDASSGGPSANVSTYSRRMPSRSPTADSAGLREHPVSEPNPSPPSMEPVPDGNPLRRVQSSPVPLTGDDIQQSSPPARRNRRRIDSGGFRPVAELQPSGESGGSRRHSPENAIQYKGPLIPGGSRPAMSGNDATAQVDYFADRGSSPEPTPSGRMLPVGGNLNPGNQDYFSQSNRQPLPARRQ